MDLIILGQAFHSMDFYFPTKVKENPHDKKFKDCLGKINESKLMPVLNDLYIKKVNNDKFVLKFMNKYGDWVDHDEEDGEE